MTKTRYGADIKLDVGHYRLDQQVACQRYRQTFTDANLKDRVIGFANSVKAAFATPVLVTA